ncbi:Semaphorin-1A [Temnothorax longispinosus]|uniref:Semaphorin-1A n=1 Tax=Temnothorax longispinosus TaxID=300112 RepID=A0A4S2KBN0_9HYME|nr:Semaphorin-1A [Temnothorax longispinosus]
MVEKTKYSLAYRILETPPVPGSENAGRDTCVIVSAKWVTLRIAPRSTRRAMTVMVGMADNTRQWSATTSNET